MKYTLLLLAGVLGGCVVVKQATKEQMQHVFTLVSPGTTAAELHQTVRTYVLSNYISARSVIEADDVSAGYLLANGRWEPTTELNYLLKHSSVTYKVSFQFFNDSLIARYHSPTGYNSFLEEAPAPPIVEIHNSIHWRAKDELKEIKRRIDALPR